MKPTNLLIMAFMAVALSMFSSCSDDDAPAEENEEEVIDLVTLTFTPDGGGSDVVVTATDPDGEGAQDLSPDGPISLETNTTYTLSITLENSAEGENITEEVAEEDEEHMFFFEFSNDMFNSPTGDGNFDNRADAVNYEDEDSNGEPLGLETTWETGGSSFGKTFRVILKHQPDIKSSTSTADDGESDIDVTWTVNIEDPS